MVQQRADQRLQPFAAGPLAAVPSRQHGNGRSGGAESDRALGRGPHRWRARARSPDAGAAQRRHAYRCRNTHAGPARTARVHRGRGKRERAASRPAGPRGNARGTRNAGGARNTGGARNARGTRSNADPDNRRPGRCSRHACTCARCIRAAGARRDLRHADRETRVVPAGRKRAQDLDGESAQPAGPENYGHNRDRGRRACHCPRRRRVGQRAF